MPLKKHLEENLLSEKNQENQKKIVLDAFEGHQAGGKEIEGYNEILRRSDIHLREDKYITRLNDLDNLIDKVPQEGASQDLLDVLHELRKVREKELRAYRLSRRNSNGEVPNIEVVVNQYHSTDLIMPVKKGDLTPKRDSDSLMDQLYQRCYSVLEEYDSEPQEKNFGEYICLSVEESIAVDKFELSVRLLKDLPSKFDGQLLKLKVANNFSIDLSKLKQLKKARKTGTTKAKKPACIEVEVKNYMFKTKHLRFKSKDRSFFPGYKKPFSVETPQGSTYQTHVAAASGAKIGDPKAGQYLSTKISEIYREIGIKEGDIVVVEKAGKGKYKLRVK